MTLLLEYGERKISSSRFITRPPYWATQERCDGDHAEPPCLDAYCWLLEQPECMCASCCVVRTAVLHGTLRALL